MVKYDTMKAHKMSITHITAKSIEQDLILRLKHSIELDVEMVTYDFQGWQKKMVCRMYMRNGFILEDSVFALLNSNDNKEIARRKVLERLISIEQYILAEKLYIDAQLDSVKKIGGTT